MCWVTFIYLLQLHIRLPVYCFVRSHWNQGNPLLFSFMLSTLFFFGAVSFFLTKKKKTDGRKCAIEVHYASWHFMENAMHICRMEVPSHQVFLITLRTDVDVDWTKAETSRNRRRWTALWPRISGQSREWAVVWTLSIISGIGGHTRAWMELSSSSLLSVWKQRTAFISSSVMANMC